MLDSPPDCAQIYPYYAKCCELGIPIMIGQRAENLGDAAVIVISDHHTSWSEPAASMK